MKKGETTEPHAGEVMTDNAGKTVLSLRTHMCDAHEANEEVHFLSSQKRNEGINENP